MTLEYLQKEMICAMKSNNIPKRDVLRSVIAAVKKTAIDNRCEATEELINDDEAAFKISAEIKFEQIISLD